MNREKKRLELQIKRNRDLQKKLEEAKMSLAKSEMDSENGFKRAKELIGELEDIKSRWEKSLNELERLQTQYQDLISKTKKLKNAMFFRRSPHID